MRCLLPGKAEYLWCRFFQRVPRIAVYGLKQRVKAASREIAWRSQHGVMFCSQILFSSATVAFRTNFLSLADFKSDLSWTNLKLSSSATWPIFEMLNSRIERDTLCTVQQACSLLCHQLWTLRIQSEDLPLTVKAKKNCRSVIAKLSEENPLRLFVSTTFHEFYEIGTVTIEAGLPRNFSII